MTRIKAVQTNITLKTYQSQTVKQQVSQRKTIRN